MKLSADLADIVGKKEASRAECVKQLWAYLKKNNLQVNPPLSLSIAVDLLGLNGFLAPCIGAFV